PMIPSLVFRGYFHRVRFIFERTRFPHRRYVHSSYARSQVNVRFLSRALAVVAMTCATSLCAQATKPVVAVDEVWIEFPASCTVPPQITVVLDGDENGAFPADHNDDNAWTGRWR